MDRNGVESDVCDNRLAGRPLLDNLGKIAVLPVRGANKHITRALGTGESVYKGLRNLLTGGRHTPPSGGERVQKRIRSWGAVRTAPCRSGPVGGEVAYDLARPHLGPRHHEGVA